MTKPVVFAGPSTFGLPEALFDHVHLRPPAVAGDVLAAIEAGAEVIGIIDGTFESAPAVWHKEILFGLAEGALIFGASSIGALRAVECEPFGMIGIGRIFAEYKSGHRTADSDVAVCHAPAELGFQPVTEPLVDVEATLLNLSQHGSIDVAESTALLDMARRMHFKARTWHAIIEACGLEGRRGRQLAKLIDERRRSAKQEDAAELLKRLAISASGQAPEPGFAPAAFSHTQYFEKLRSSIVT